MGPPLSSSPAGGRSAPVSSKEVRSKRQLVEPEVIALNELLDTFSSEIDDAQHESRLESHKRQSVGIETVPRSLQHFLPRQQHSDLHDSFTSLKANERPHEGKTGNEGEEEWAQNKVASVGPSGAKHTKLAELEQHVRNLERDNLHLKQALLLSKKAAGRNATDISVSDAEISRVFAERTKVVTEMAELFNATHLSLSDASRVWHKDCRIGMGVREWDAYGRLQIISLWNMIRSVFTSIVVDIVELRPHLPDGEIILSKWRIQGEIASVQHLERVCASEDCPATMRVALMAIKSSDLTFTLTTYTVFQELRIAEQYHSWDQVGIFKRLFGGDIPPSVQKMLVIDEETAAGRKQPLEV